MSVFYVVTKVQPNDTEYVRAYAFTNTNPDYDNEAAAKELVAELKASQPWATHTVSTEDEFKSATGDKPAENLSTPSDPQSAPAPVL